MVSLVEMVMEPVSLVSIDGDWIRSGLGATSRYKLLEIVGQRHPNGLSGLFRLGHGSSRLFSHVLQGMTCTPHLQSPHPIKALQSQPSNTITVLH